MRMERFYTVLGLFIGGAVVLSLFTTVYFYDLYVREKEDTYVMFFKGSLEGLNAASTITYNGIKIGEVKLIEITENSAKNDIRIPVYSQFFIDKTYNHKQKNPIHILLNKGYVANIKNPNFITGVASIELVKSPTPVKFQLNRYNGYVIFPTINKSEASGSLDETLKTATKTLKDVTEFINSPRVRETIDATKALADSLNQLARHLDEQAPPFITTFIKTLLNISNSANSFQNLTDYLTRNPEALLRGRS